MSAVWPEVSHRLAKLLTSRGAAPDVVDDVVQEVAARVLAKGIVFDDAMDLMRWAVPVALNLLVDNARASLRIAPGLADHDEPVGDVADLVAHRDRLRRVMRALPLLSAADRAALTNAEATPADRKEAVRLAVRRHRARRRLLALVDGVAAFVALAGGLLRRSGRGAATATVAVAIAPVAFVLAPGGQAEPLPTPAPAQAPRELAIDARHSVRAERAVRPASAARVEVRAVPRRARPAPAPVRAAAPRRAAPVARVASPKGETAVTVTQRRGQPGDAIVCVGGTGLAPDVCVYPIRQHGGGTPL